MKQFRYRKTNRNYIPQKTLLIEYEKLKLRLEIFQELNRKYKESIDQDQEKIEHQKYVSNQIVKYDIEQNVLQINDKQYQIKPDEWIIQHLDKFHMQIEHQAQHIVELKYLSAIEFYMLCSSLCINNKIHFQFNDICTICQFELFEIEEWNEQNILQNDKICAGLPCDHYYHLDCLNYCIKEDHIQCPVCSKIYGIKTGDQPPGKMRVQLDPQIHCEGYEDCPTIIIDYDMYAGIRNNHPFPPTRRIAFLPDNKDGRQILRLLRIAFERKLIFTVGRSVTTGKDNRIVWSGIHHKTNLNGGVSNFGYPDLTYFNRVREELGAKGIF